MVTETIDDQTLARYFNNTPNDFTLSLPFFETVEQCANWCKHVVKDEKIVIIQGYNREITDDILKVLTVGICEKYPNIHLIDLRKNKLTNKSFEHLQNLIQSTKRMKYVLLLKNCFETLGFEWTKMEKMIWISLESDWVDAKDVSSVKEFHDNFYHTLGKAILLPSELSNAGKNDLKIPDSTDVKVLTFVKMVLAQNQIPQRVCEDCSFPVFNESEYCKLCIDKPRFDYSAHEWTYQCGYMPLDVEACRIARCECSRGWNE